MIFTYRINASNCRSMYECQMHECRSKPKKAPESQLSIPSFVDPLWCFSFPLCLIPWCFANVLRVSSLWLLVAGCSVNLPAIALSEAAVWSSISPYLLLNYSIPHVMVKPDWEALSSICTAGKATQENTGQLLPTCGSTGPSVNVCQFRDPNTSDGDRPALMGKEHTVKWGCSEKKGPKGTSLPTPFCTATENSALCSHPALSPRLSPQWGKSVEVSMRLPSQQWWSWSMAARLSLTNNCSSYYFQLFFCRIIHIFLIVIKTIIILWKYFTR